MPRALRAIARNLFVRAPVKENLKLPRACESQYGDGKCATVRDVNEATCNGDLPDDVDENMFGDVLCAPISLTLLACFKPCRQSKQWLPTGLCVLGACVMSSCMHVHSSARRGSKLLLIASTSMSTRQVYAGCASHQMTARRKRAATAFPTLTLSCL